MREGKEDDNETYDLDDNNYDEDGRRIQESEVRDNNSTYGQVGDFGFK